MIRMRLPRASLRRGGRWSSRRRGTLAHRRHAESVTDLADQPWGERAFHAVLLGYRFLIAAGG